MTAVEPPSPKDRAIPSVSLAMTLAEMLYFRRHSLWLTRELYLRYGEVALQRMGPFTSVHLFGPEASRYVMLDRENCLSAEQSWTMIMGRIFPGGLLLKDGDEHRHHRGIMLDAFTKSAIADYCTQMGRPIEETVTGWTHGSKTMEAFPAYKSLTLDLATRVFLGLELKEETARLNEAFQAAVAASMSLIRIPIPGLEFDRGRRGRRYLVELFRPLVEKRRRNPGNDMISRLCEATDEAGARFSDQEIVDHTIFLLMAAHDTTTSTLTSMTWELARNPQWQERLRKESLALDQSILTYDRMADLRSMNLVLQEILRRYTPLSTVPRTATRSFEFGGFVIPQGAMVTTYPLHTHHMEEWWSNPFDFDPERFSTERAEHKRHSHSYVPFSGGAHTCIGLRFAEMQIRSVMHALLQNYRWWVDEGYEMPVQQAPISKPVDGLPIHLERL